jgi:hypothetical protein
MKPWLKAIARLGITGACVLAIGCGGGDVPDTSTEGRPAAGEAAASGDAGPASEPKTEVASAEPAQSAPKAAAAGKEEEAAPSEPSTPAAAQAPAKKEGGSTTAEMYALATTPSTGANPPAAGAAPNAPAAGAPPAGASGPGGMSGGGAGMMAMMQGQGRPNMGPGAPGAQGPGGAGGMMNPGMMASAMGGMRQGMGQPGMAGGNPSDMAKMMAGRMGAGAGARQGMPGMAGMPGAAGGATDNALGPGGGSAPGAAGATNEPVNLRTPEGAVRAFLNALKKKDLDSLNEAMALHAPTEAASQKTRDIFQKIFDLNLADADLDDIAKKLEGYQIVGENPAKSTGRLDVVIQKQGDNGAFFRRRVTVRKEKKGWGVVDISGPSEFKAMNNYGQRRKGY